MAKPTVKLNKDGFYALRRDPKVRELEERIAQQIASECGDGYKTSSVQGRKDPQGRWRTTVITATRAAAKDNSQNNTLMKNGTKRRTV